MIQKFNESFQEMQGSIEDSKCNMQIFQFDAQNPSAVLEAINKTVSQSLAIMERRSSQHHHMQKPIPVRLESATNLSNLVTTVATSVYKVSPNAYRDVVGNLSAIKNNNILEKVNPMIMELAEDPFSSGAQNLAYRAYDQNTQKKMVFKRSKFGEISYEDRKSSCVETREKLKVYIIAESYARVFNTEKPQNAPKICFAEVGICEVKDGVSGIVTYTFEDFIEGDYEKFNNNVGWTLRSPRSAVLDSFSHYTWVKSNKELVVCDLQGVVKYDRIYLTDPAIHCRDYMKLGRTNFSTRGMKEFFSRHRCNEICKTMKLEPFS